MKQAGEAQARRRSGTEPEVPERNPPTEQAVIQESPICPILASNVPRIQAFSF